MIANLYRTARLTSPWQVDFTASPPKILPVKPKVYMLCNLVLPAGCGTDLCA